jgi:hypothetical protein
MAREEQYIDETEEEPGEGLGNALVVVTTLILIAAVVIVLMAAKEYGAGMLAGN